MFGKKYCPIGLDFGSKFIKAVQLTEREGKYTLHHYAMAAPAVGCLDEGVIIDRGALIKTLKKLLRKKFKGQAVNFCICGRQIYLHTSLLPILDKGELDEAAYWEIERQLKGQMDDPVVDYLVIGEEEQEGQLMSNVLIAAVPRLVVEDYLSVLEGVGLEPHALEIKQIPLFRMLQGGLMEHYYGHLALVLDIGAGETVFVMMNGKKIAAAGTLNIGVDSPTGFSAERLLVEIKHLLEPFDVDPGGEGGSVGKLYLAGGGSLAEDSLSHLKENLRMDLQIMKPFSTFLLPGKGLKDREFCNLVPSFMVALGLSMRLIQKGEGGSSRGNENVETPGPGVYGS